MQGRSCCTPGRAEGQGAAAPAQAAPVPHAVAQDPAVRWVAIGATAFRMGTDSDEGFAADGEGPSREVRLSPYRIAATTVTNRAFGDFVRATQYATEAEQAGSSFVFYLQLPPALRGAARRTAAGLPWWLNVGNACWQRPEGSGSHIRDRLDHPAVHISWNDAQAYCAWSGTRLPTEAEWECAARGGLAGRRYPWGDELEVDGRLPCNIWHGAFPEQPAAPWQPGTVPADAYAPNGLGLYNMAGNVWEWCADWFGPDYHRRTEARDPLGRDPTGMRSLRGGSFLCHASYCNRYRAAARGANTPQSSASNIGFRVAQTG